MKFALNEHFLLITNASLIRDTFVDGYITAILPKGLSTKIFFMLPTISLSLMFSSQRKL